MPTSQLFGEEVDDGDIHIFRGSVTDHKRTTGGPEIISLSGGRSTAGLTAFLLRPSAEFEDERRAEHSGTEAAFIIEGSIEIQFSDRVVALSQGDYVQFPGHADSPGSPDITQGNRSDRRERRLTALLFHGRFERVREIGHEIRLILEPNGKPYQAVADFGNRPCIRTHTCVGHRGGMRDKAFNAA